MCIKWICIFYIVLRFFVNDTATTEISTYCHSLSLHDALPISLDYSSWDAATLADFNKQNAFAGMRQEVQDAYGALLSNPATTPDQLQQFADINGMAFDPRHVSAFFDARADRKSVP